MGKLSSASSEEASDDVVFSLFSLIFFAAGET
jgi:hypothetical protein